jgi:hypothetical protein
MVKTVITPAQAKELKAMGEDFKDRRIALSK